MVRQFAERENPKFMAEEIDPLLSELEFALKHINFQSHKRCKPWEPLSIIGNYLLQSRYRMRKKSNRNTHSTTLNLALGSHGDQGQFDESHGCLKSNTSTI